MRNILILVIIGLFTQSCGPRVKKPSDPDNDSSSSHKPKKFSKEIENDPNLKTETLKELHYMFVKPEKDIKGMNKQVYIQTTIEKISSSSPKDLLVRDVNDKSTIDKVIEEKDPNTLAFIIISGVGLSTKGSKTQSPIKYLVKRYRDHGSNTDNEWITLLGDSLFRAVVHAHSPEQKINASGVLKDVIEEIYRTAKNDKQLKNDLEFLIGQTMFNSWDNAYEIIVDAHNKISDKALKEKFLFSYLTEPLRNPREEKGFDPRTGFWGWRIYNNNFDLKLENTINEPTDEISKYFGAMPVVLGLTVLFRFQKPTFDMSLFTQKARLESLFKSIKKEDLLGWRTENGQSLEDILTMKDDGALVTQKETDVYVKELYKIFQDLTK